MADEVKLDGKENQDRLLSRRMPVCAKCANWHIGEETCEAFTDQIPDEIFILGNPHREPFAGDNGIRFEQATDET